ncbi:MAG: outer membrane beta-barrel protein [Desulfovibrio sp.]|nr:outer membrane beta-barrel protein [Desulfovibrio sp.]MCA1987119.1 outer membrane beta-barrel protein [Desulfovibrio sp.]
MKKLLLLASLALALTLGAVTAQAASTDAERFYIQPEVGLYGTSSKDVSTIFTYGLSAGVFVTDGLALGGEFLGYYLSMNSRSGYWHNRYDAANGFGFNGLIRYYPFTAEQASMYIGTGLGGLFTDERLVYNGYYSSLTLPVDLGVTIDVTDQFSLDLGGRYQRIGFSRHGLDAWGGNLGMSIVF